MKSLTILLILAIGVSLIFSFVPSAYAAFATTQPNAYVSYNSGTNEVQVSWDFTTGGVDAPTICLLKGDFWFYTDVDTEFGDTGVPDVDYTKITGFIPKYYSVVSSNPTIIGTDKTTEIIPCSGNARIDLDTVMNHPSNIDLDGNHPEDLQIFLSFYAVDDTFNLETFNFHTLSYMDQIFVFYTPTVTWSDAAIDYACKDEPGNVIYIDQSGIHGNNGDNCDKYLPLNSNQYVDIGGANNSSLRDGETSFGMHDEQYPLIQTNLTPPVITVPDDITVQTTNSDVPVSFTVTALDEVDGEVTPTCDPVSGSSFPLGITTVSCSATDAGNNTSTESFSVTVTLTSGGGGCSGDCIIPTFYTNKSGVKVVKNGFSFSGNAIDVSGYHTPYDLITVNTNQVYNLKLKVYENNYLEWVQIGFGMPEIGSPLNDAESLTTVYLNVDKSIDRLVTIEKHTLVDISRISVSMVECGYTEQECYLIDIDFVYRDQQKNNIIAIEAVDRARNNVIHYINDGILIVGKSMNVPLEQLTTASHGGAFYPQRAGTVLLTLVDYKTNMWQDEYGYMWSTTQYGPYMVDEVPKPIKDTDPISKVMTRMHSNFESIIQHEQDRAVMIFDASKLVSVLGETFAYEYNTQSQEEDQKIELAIKLEIEADRATKLTKDYSLNQSLYHATT